MTPSCLAARPAPATPQDLTAHRCINYRQSEPGCLYPWEFERDGRALNVRVEDPLAFNDAFPALDAAVEGLGLAYVPEEIAMTLLCEQRRVQVLGDWCPSASGYYLYYPSRQQMVPDFGLLVEALRYRGARPA